MCDVVVACVDNEDVAARGGDTPYFVALEVFAEVGDVRAYGNFGYGLELDEIDDGEGAIGSGDVGVHVEIGTEERWSMLKEEKNGGGYEQDDEDEVDAWAFVEGHCLS